MRAILLGMCLSAVLSVPAFAAEPPLPPAAPIPDVKSIAGRWQVALTDRRTGQTGSFIWEFRGDGSFEQIPQGYTGVFRIVEGKVLYRNVSAGKTGVLTLHVDGGRRLLRGGSDDGAFSFVLTPASLPPSRAGDPSARTLPRVGVLSTTIGPVALRQMFQEAGYADGTSIVLEDRSSKDPSRLREMAAELVGLRVSVILATSTSAAQAAKAATGTIPIVFISLDPVAAGLVPSLARPGTNLTGVSAMSPEITAKRLELLREIVPGLSRVAVLVNPSHAAAAAQLRELEGAARTLGLQIHLVSLESPSLPLLERGLAEAAAAGARGLVVVPDPVMIGMNYAIARSALAARVAAIGEDRELAVLGGLLTYGPSYLDLFRRSVGYVDRILKGARPGDLPVEQPTRFELTVNAKTANALGLTVPPTLLLRADRVIE